MILIVDIVISIVCVSSTRWFKEIPMIIIETIDILGLLPSVGTICPITALSHEAFEIIFFFNTCSKKWSQLKFSIFGMLCQMYEANALAD